MLGDTITVTVNAVAKAMKKINQDSFSSEYLLRETLMEYRLKIRHSQEKALVSGRPMDRHNVEFTQTTYPVGSTDPGRVRQVYYVIRNSRDDAAAEVDYLGDGLADWLKTNTPLLVGWES